LNTALLLGIDLFPDVGDGARNCSNPVSRATFNVSKGIVSYFDFATFLPGNEIPDVIGYSPGRPITMSVEPCIRVEASGHGADSRFPSSTIVQNEGKELYCYNVKDQVER